MPRIVFPFDQAAPDDEDFFYGGFRNLLTDGETISSATIETSPSGLTVGAPAILGDQVRVKLSGGTAATKYFITFAIVTSTARTLERTTSVTLGAENRPLD